LQPGDYHFDALVQVEVSVVFGELDGHYTELGKLATGQPVQAKAEQVLCLLLVLDLLL
jgi:hypothetical protein